ncbi:MAG: GNAT family N-acetyltransferase [Bauldia sp.]
MTVGVVGMSSAPLSPSDPLLVDAQGRVDEIAALLEERLYEFNVRATGFSDGKPVCFTIANDAGAIIAGIAGYTWGGCCHIRQLWVDEAHRGGRLGTALLEAAEREAMERNCRQVVISTHTFQAPGFYARLGYTEVARVVGHPIGHANVFLAKQLAASR